MSTLFPGYLTVLKAGIKIKKTTLVNINQCGKSGML